MLKTAGNSLPLFSHKPTMFAEHTLYARHQAGHKEEQDLLPVIRSWMMNGWGREQDKHNGL